MCIHRGECLEGCVNYPGKAKMIFGTTPREVSQSELLSTANVLAADALMHLRLVQPPVPESRNLIADLVEWVDAYRQYRRQK